MIGGLEHVVLNLATQVSALDHQVCVITQTIAEAPDDFPFRVFRQPSFITVVQLISRSDVAVQFNISLKGILPWLIAARPLIITHHGIYPRQTLAGRLKWGVSQLAALNTGCSLFISRQYRCGQWLPNPYHESVFYRQSGSTRPKTLVFLGRLVSEKGCSVLLQAMYDLKRSYNLTPDLTIIGEGPEYEPLSQLADELGIHAQISFTGSQTGAALAALLNQHIMLIVPSVYEEPFGIVALEGVACGCFVIGSQAGGLPEAIGPCGVTFPPGNSQILASLINKAINEPAWRDQHQDGAAAHLARHTRQAVAQRFIALVDRKR